MTTEKHEPIIWLKELNLKREQRELLAMLINIFGDGMHPFADSDNLDGFSVSYLKEVLAKPEFIEGKTKQTAEILTILESVEEILKNY